MSDCTIAQTVKLRHADGIAYTVKRRHDEYSTYDWLTAITAAAASGMTERDWSADNGVEYRVYKRYKTDLVPQLRQHNAKVLSDCHPLNTGLLPLVCRYLTCKDIGRLRRVCKAMNDETLNLTWRDLQQHQSGDDVWTNRNTVLPDSIFNVTYGHYDTKQCTLCLAPSITNHVVHSIQSDARSMNICRSVQLEAGQPTVWNQLMPLGVQLADDTVNVSAYHASAGTIAQLTCLFPQLRTLVLSNIKYGNIVHNVFRLLPNVVNMALWLNPYVNVLVVDDVSVQGMTSLKRLALDTAIRLSSQAFLTITQLALVELHYLGKLSSELWLQLTQSKATASLQSLAIGLDNTTPILSRHFASSVSFPELTRLKLYRTRDDTYDGIWANNDPNSTVLPDVDLSCMRFVLSACPRISQLTVRADAWYLDQVLPYLSNALLLRID